MWIWFFFVVICCFFSFFSANRAMVVAISPVAKSPQRTSIGSPVLSLRT